MSSFWTRDEAKVMGDLVSRPPTLGLAGDLRGRRVAELGCGSGWFTRQLEAGGARAFGCERDAQSILESRSSRVAMMDAQRTGFRSNTFDAVFAVGVLGLARPTLERKILREACRIARPGATVIVGVTHPSVYATGSVSRSGGRNWVTHTPRYRLPMSISQPFEERYVRSDGVVLVWNVWYHPAAFYRTAIADAGLTIEREEEPLVTPEMLDHSPHWGSKYGDPAVLLWKARK